MDLRYRVRRLLMRGFALDSRLNRSEPWMKP